MLLSPPIYAEIFFIDLILWKSCAGNHRSYELMCVTTMYRILSLSSPVNSYNSWPFFQNVAQAVDRQNLIQMIHPQLSTQKLLLRDTLAR